MLAGQWAASLNFVPLEQAAAAALQCRSHPKNVLLKISCSPLASVLPLAAAQMSSIRTSMTFISLFQLEKAASSIPDLPMLGISMGAFAVRLDLLQNVVLLTQLNNFVSCHYEFALEVS